MNKALENAIYYIHGDTHLKYNVVTELLYDGTLTNFTDVINGFRSNINIRNLFGNTDNICYKICDEIVKCYNKLLLGQLDFILIVTRQDNALKIIKAIDKTKDNCRNDIGVIKIDSVISELNLNNLIQNNTIGWIKYPAYLIGLTGLFFVGRNMYNDYVFE